MSQQEEHRRRRHEDDAPEDRPGEPGAEGGSKSESADKLPALPSDDDAPLGDTDQHSSQ